MHFLFCPQCGEKLIEKNMGDEGNVPFCENCNVPFFDMFSSCIIVLVTNEDGEVALLKQSYISNKYYNLVSGYMKPGEIAEETALREVEEEIGVKLENLKFSGTYWFGKKDMLMIGFIGFAHKTKLNLSVEVDSAKWVPAHEAIKLVHPSGSVSHILVQKYLDSIFAE